MLKLSLSFKPLIKFIFFILLVIFAGWINAIRLNIIGIKKDGLIELPVIILIGFFLLILLKRLKRIDFDSDYIYISNRKSDIIPLENIIKVKLILIEIGSIDFYKILYKTKEGESKTVRFLPSNNFTKFQQLLKEKNKNVIIQHNGHSFDI